MRNAREILYEFRKVGNAVRVAAIDSQTGLEVQIVGSARVGKEELRRVAAQKLVWRLEKLQNASRR